MHHPMERDDRAGKPLKDLGRERHDPDWWLRQLIDREQLTGLLPPALALRKETLELDARLDAEPSEQQVRQLLDEFNQRVVDARRQLNGGPPVVTPTRDVEADVQAWRQRRADRIQRQRQTTRGSRAAAEAMPPEPGGPSDRAKRRGWFRRSSG